MSISHTKIFLQGSFIYISGNVVVGLLNYFIRRTMALNLSEVDYGCFYGAFAFISLIMAFTDLGFVQAGTVLISENSGKNERNNLKYCISSILQLKLFLGLTAFLIVLLFHQSIVAHYLGGTGSTAFLCLSGLLVFQVCETAFTALWNGTRKFLTTNMISTFRTIVLFLLAFFLTRQYAITGAALAYLITSIVFLLVSLLLSYLREGIPLSIHIPGTIRKRLFKLIGFIAYSTLMLNMIFHMDTIMLTALKGVESSAIYNIALPVAQLVFSPLVFATVFLPIAVSMVRERKYRELLRVAKVSILITIISIPLVAGGMYLFAPFLIRLLFAERFVAAAAPVLPWLAGGFLFYALGNMIMQILIAFDNKKAILTTTTLTCICNLLFNFVFIRFFDVAGAALATCLSYFLFCVLTILYFFLQIQTRKDESSNG